MSTRDLRAPPIRYVRNTRWGKFFELDVDLNVVPPNEIRDQEGTSAHVGSQSQDGQAGQQGGSIPHAPIDLEAFDDDVVLSSPRTFAEAKNNSSRNHVKTLVVDVDSEEESSRFVPNNHNKRRRISAKQTIINCDLYINLEGTSNSKREEVQSVAPPSRLPPKEPTFNCPVCMGPLVEEMSTKCGHIFCRSCIKAAIGSRGKCPTCRRKITMKGAIRVYLPAAS